jgi:ankyrin repeat protein
VSNSSADINLRDENGQSPLFTASMHGHCDVVKYLISSGADINLRDENGQSPLFIASCKGECDVVHKLISAPELSKHLTTSQCPDKDASNNGDLPSWLHKLISAPDFSKHLTTSHSPLDDAITNGECLRHHCLDTVMLLNVY